MSELFISHSSRDDDLARTLEKRLGARDYNSIFLDFDPDQGIPAGQSWERTIYRKLRACDAIIAILSDTYLASQWCFAELALARMERKPVFALKTGRLNSGAKLPSILLEHQYITSHRGGRSVRTPMGGPAPGPHPRRNRAGVGR